MKALIEGRRDGVRVETERRGGSQIDGKEQRGTRECLERKTHKKDARFPKERCTCSVC